VQVVEHFRGSPRVKKIIEGASKCTGLMRTSELSGFIHAGLDLTITIILSPTLSLLIYQRVNPLIRRFRGDQSNRMIFLQSFLLAVVTLQAPGGLATIIAAHI
jgi:hypothetical protein